MTEPASSVASDGATDLSDLADESSGGFSHFQLWLIQNNLSPNSSSAVWFALIGSMVSIVQEHLSAVLDQPVRVGGLTQLPAEARPTGDFGVTLVHPCLKSPALVLCDAMLARAFADSVQTGLRVPRGAGPLSDIECGLMEYFTLLVSERIASSLKDTKNFPSIARFLNSRDLATISAEELVHYGFIEIPLFVGARWGKIFVGLPVLDQNMVVPNFDIPADIRSHYPSQKSDVSLTLAMRPIVLTPAEESAMSVGDVLLTGRESIQSPASQCELIATSGWRLFNAEVVVDSATMLKTNLSEPALRPWRGVATARPHVYWPTIGNATVSCAELGSLETRGSIELSRRAGDVIVWTQGRRAWRGELVRVNSEMGIMLQARYE